MGVRRRTRRRTLELGALLVVVAVALPLVGVAVPEAFGVDEGYLVRPGSGPGVDVADVVLVDRVPPEAVHVGDSIAYRVAGADGDARVATARVEAVLGREGRIRFRTAGGERATVPGDRLVGRVVLRVAAVGGRLHPLTAADAHVRTSAHAGENISQ
ncbi:hypothetical protein [Halomarina litorea]|uniref:hypothetical protein n=1 Tax=Halomarina litorea TaxID=2961595 RepID=UPI0020C2B78F|nr:hypothetical protein [Halomarina sp. BCD28]